MDQTGTTPAVGGFRNQNVLNHEFLAGRVTREQYEAINEIQRENTKYEAGAAALVAGGWVAAEYGILATIATGGDALLTTLESGIPAAEALAADSAGGAALTRWFARASIALGPLIKEGAKGAARWADEAWSAIAAGGRRAGRRGDGRRLTDEATGGEFLDDLPYSAAVDVVDTPGTYTTRIRWGIQDIDARPHPTIEGAFWGRRVPQKNPRVDAFELRVNPNNESLYLPHPDVGGFVQFEGMVGTVAQDGKLVMSATSIYHTEDLPGFAAKQGLGGGKKAGPCCRRKRAIG